MSTPAEPAPKAFISYSWSTPDHEQRVLDLATELRDSGVDVILDKWDLSEGQEATVFMERIVSDPDVRKVLIVSDRLYCEKSDARRGGAGTEAQIISSRLYEQQDEGKFVALIFERDDYGKPYVPAYYTSRVFIDFTDASRYTDRFEQLLRWIFGRPQFEKPKIGSRPSYLDDNAAISLPTSASYRRAMDAVQGGKSFAYPAVIEFFSTLLEELPAFKISSSEDIGGEEIMRKYGDFVPYRNECIEIVKAICRYTEDERFGKAIHDFLEGFLPYFHPQQGRYREIDFDNFKFFAHELFLHFSTLFVRERRSDLFSAIVDTAYYDSWRAERERDGITDYTGFRHFDGLLDARKKELGLRRISLQADLLKERTIGSGILFEHLMEVDFILFLRSRLEDRRSFGGWFPVTIYLMGHRARVFELFARSRSTKEFQFLLNLLGLEERRPLDHLIGKYRSGELEGPRLGDWDRVDVPELTGFDHLGTLP
ncbi:SEFIR domain-containing protein [Pseudoroseicyclus tamaricis]|uniref:TIR domain-containing protein n=1 Tax=Pseudoroseicyclus tamaricis TaxID=2705421 RepID=A0A6B2JFA9_9RHOB|nr:TIR domain-containing protein [Pseudoroseicyclus tamaricis]NDU99700.1 TIR domain-containing protein [Pseudoroseicyclus tamaricis]